MDEIKKAIQVVCKDVFNVETDVILTRPDEQFGDYATNVALQITKQVGKNPREIAQTIADNLKGDLIASVEVAGPGFINIRLTDGALLANVRHLTEVPASTDKVVLVEYSDPNPLKPLHAGHLYTTLVGDAIARTRAATRASDRGS